MGNRTLKYGGKSGILPKPRPIFRQNPIRPMTEAEKQKYESVEQGYAENIPLPVKKGFKFQRRLEPKPVVTVEERIKNTIEHTGSKDIDTSKMSEEQIWKLKVGDIRRAHLREAYLKEHERLKKIHELELKSAQEAKEKAAHPEEFEESEATKLTLPTIESYLNGPVMRQRTETEQVLLENKRTLNRKTRELEQQEKKTEQLLDLYHQAGNFITTEEQLEKAIVEAFEIKLNKFNVALSSVRDKMSGAKDSNIMLNENEQDILDAAHGEIRRRPGLNVVRDTIDGELEKLKRQAELAANKY